MPEAIPAEDRRQFHPPAWKAAPEKPKQTEKQKPGMGEFKSLMKEKNQPEIRRGDKLRAEVLNIEGKQIRVRLLQKDEGRVLTFTAAYLPAIKIGDKILVNVEQTASAGNEVTKITFKSKIQ